MITHALVTSRLKYCNELYMGLPLKNIQKLQLLQNAIAQTARLEPLSPYGLRLGNWYDCLSPVVLSTPSIL